MPPLFFDVASAAMSADMLMFTRRYAARHTLAIFLRAAIFRHVMPIFDVLLRLVLPLLMLAHFQTCHAHAFFDFRPHRRSPAIPSRPAALARHACAARALPSREPLPPMFAATIRRALISFHAATPMPMPRAEADRCCSATLAPHIARLCRRCAAFDAVADAD